MQQTSKKSTLGFAEALQKVLSGQPVTRLKWTKSRILKHKDSGIVEIQHDIKSPITTWWPSREDMEAEDYVLAHFNSQDATQPLN